MIPTLFRWSTRQDIFIQGLCTANGTVPKAGLFKSLPLYLILMIPKPETWTQETSVSLRLHGYFFQMASTRTYIQDRHNFAPPAEYLFEELPSTWLSTHPLPHFLTSKLSMPSQQGFPYCSNVPSFLSTWIPYGLSTLDCGNHWLLERVSSQVMFCMDCGHYCGPCHHIPLCCLILIAPPCVLILCGFWKLARFLFASVEGFCTWLLGW